jgi:hypothetical protein
MSFMAKLKCLLREDGGQVLPFAAAALTCLLGMASIALDVGRVMYASRELQATTDATALAGAEDMLGSGATVSSVIGASGTFYSTVGTPSTTIQKYSAITNGLNQRVSLQTVTVAATPKCLNSLLALGQPCTGTMPYNAIQVTQTAQVPTIIAGMFGHKKIPISSMSTAAVRGGAPKPSNVAVIIDTTLSANSVDTNCSNLTEMQCSLNGFQVLLKSLNPCPTDQGACNAVNGIAPNSFDRVSLFTFPNVSTGTVSQDTSCTTSVPTPTSANGYWNSMTANLGLSNFNFVMPLSPTGATPITPYSDIPTAMSYSFPPATATSYSAITAEYPTNPITYGSATYQVTGYLSDYKTSDAATALNASSLLVTAAGGKGGCGGMAPPNFDGEYGTYYAGVIYAAQASLIAEHTSFPGSQNVIIILSDGNATAPQNSNGFAVMPSSNITNPATAGGTYPSWVDECGQAVHAAQLASAAGTTVYSVAYGSEPTGCTSDTLGGTYSNGTSYISTEPCDTMANMASAPQEFYSDYQQSGSGSTCIASQPVVALNDIFQSIANDLTLPRLIPNNTQ